MSSSKLSALPLRSLRLCGSSVASKLHRRDAENTEEAQRVERSEREEVSQNSEMDVCRAGMSIPGGSIHQISEN